MLEKGGIRFVSVTPPQVSGYYKYEFTFSGSGHGEDGHIYSLRGTTGGSADDIYRYDPFEEDDWAEFDDAEDSEEFKRMTVERVTEIGYVKK